jgi:hypothetical protein
MTFGEALVLLKNDKSLARSGWNGKHMFIYLKRIPSYAPCFVMRTAQGEFQPGWLASQANMLAEDWVEV